MKQDESGKVQSTHILEMYASGTFVKDIAAELHVGYDTIYNELRAKGIEIKRRKKKPGEHRGRYKYICVPGHPGANKSGYIAEHTVMATKVLGRPLKKGEVVHHINGNTWDNRNSNLLICTQSYHRWLHGEMSRRYQQEHFA